MTISPNLVELLELSVSSGIYVITIAAGSPAEKVGLIEGGRDDLGQLRRGGDVITAVDGIEVSTVEDFVAYLKDKEPGNKISISVRRSGEYFTVGITLGEWPEGL
jgi:serine protease Do